MRNDRDRQARRTRATRTAVISLGTVGALGAAGAIGVGIAESKAAATTATNPATNTGATQSDDSTTGDDANRRQDNGFVPQQTRKSQPNTRQAPKQTRHQAPLASSGNGGSSQGSSSGS
jgi:hypothetical protein